MTLDVNWVPKQDNLRTSMLMDPAKTGHAEAIVVTKYSRATMAVGPHRYPRGYGKYVWLVEFDVRVGWSHRFHANGDAKSLKEAKRSAVEVVETFLAVTSAAKPVDRPQVENEVLKATVRKYRDQASLLRYVINNDVKDEVLKEALLRYATSFDG